MSLEQSIQNLADAINNLVKGQRFASFAAFDMEGMPPTRDKDEILNTRIVGSNQTVAEVVASAGQETTPKVEKTKPAAAEKQDISPELDAKAKAAAEKARQLAAEESSKAEEPKAVEGEVITADEKTEEEIRQEAFGAPDGYIYKPFIALGQGGKNVAAQKAICAQFGVQRISLVPLDQIPALKAAVEAALAEVQG